MREIIRAIMNPKLGTKTKLVLVPIRSGKAMTSEMVEIAKTNAKAPINEMPKCCTKT